VYFDDVLVTDVTDVPLANIEMAYLIFFSSDFEDNFNTNGVK
jgi:hypothetical protein